jgi:plastocyanin
MSPLRDFRRYAIALLIAGCLAMRSTRCAAATIRGMTDFTVVWVSAADAVPPPVQAVLTNHHRSFIPSTIVIPVGSTVRFPNLDPFYHSIYSTSAADPFDIGFYDTGPGKIVSFAHAGIVQVHCHIHVSMHATIIVVDGPFAQRSNGRYVLTGVPVGVHTLHAWNPLLGERTISVRVPNANTTINLAILAPHEGVGRIPVPARPAASPRRRQ